MQLKLDKSTLLEWHSLNFAGKTVALYNEHALFNSKFHSNEQGNKMDSV